MDCPLVAETRRLTERLAGQTPAWFDARTPAGPTRAELLRGLVLRLADLGRETGAGAGAGAPPGVVPPALRAHGLADQVTVLVADLVELAEPGAEPARTAAAAEVTACYDALVARAPS